MYALLLCLSWKKDIGRTDKVSQGCWRLSQIMAPKLVLGTFICPLRFWGHLFFLPDKKVSNFGLNLSCFIVTRKKAILIKSTKLCLKACARQLPFILCHFKNTLLVPKKLYFLHCCTNNSKHLKRLSFVVVHNQKWYNKINFF